MSGNTGPNEDSEPRAVQWAPLAGIWSFEGRSVAYQSPTSGTTLPYGLAVSNVRLRDGRVGVSITFGSLEDGARGNPAAGVVLGYQGERASYVLPQLGAYGSAYAIARYEPALGWVAEVRAGSVRNLRAGHTYEVEVVQTGQQVRLSVDGVPIFSHVLSEPLAGSQLGLFAWGEARVDFSHFTWEQRQPRAFVAMQFSEPYNTLYREVILPKAQHLGFEVRRIDEVSKPGIIFEDIKRELAESKVVIAEITAPNQNVFYELGYAHALNKPTILLAQRGHELPFDIRSYRVIFYDDSIAGKPTVERDLEKHLRAVMSDS